MIATLSLGPLSLIDVRAPLQGSSALQLVPALQPHVSKLYNYVRGKTWLSVPFASNTFADLLHRDEASAENCECFPGRGMADMTCPCDGPRSKSAPS